MQTASSKCKNSDYSLDVSLLSKSSITIKNSDYHGINQKALLLAALSPAYFKAWSSFLTFCNLVGLHPLETSGHDIVHWLNCELDSSEPLRILDNYLNLVKNIRQPASNPIADIQIHKYSEANSLLLMDLEPRHIQNLIHEAIYEFGSDTFVIDSYSSSSFRFL